METNLGIFSKIKVYGAKSLKADGIISITEKDIFRDKELLDLFAREFWNLPKRSTDNYFARTTSINWFGFLENINKNEDVFDWDYVKDFVQSYCKTFNKDCQSYLDLYTEIEKMGYSPVFKSKAMK